MDIVAVDIETVRMGSQPSPYRDTILSIALNDGDRVEISEDVSKFEDILGDSKILKVFQNGVFDIQFLEFASFGLVIENIWDTMIAERLLTAGTNQPCDLGYIVDKYCGKLLDKSIRETFTNHRGPLTKQQLDYAKDDVRYLLDVQRQQYEALKARGMLEVMDLENRLVPIVARMELIGVGFDQSVWDEILKEEEELLPKLEQRAQRELSESFAYDIFSGGYVGMLNLDSPVQLLRALHRVGVNVSSTGAEVLSEYSHPAVKAILEYREHAKRLQWDYPKYVNPTTRRIHPSYKQTGARTGRFSCTNPNLQNVPRDKLFRSMFVPKVGYKFIVTDYDQQELRVLAEMSGDMNLQKACRGDPHLENARLIFGDLSLQKDSEERTVAKTCIFALVYGASLGTFAATAGLSREEARKTYRRLKMGYPRVEAWGREMWDFLKQNGYVKTLSGRRRYFPGVARDPGKYMRVAANTPIQGSSADMLKLAMVYIYEDIQKYDAAIVLSVHDEVVVEVWDKQADIVAEVVEKAMVRAGGYYLKSVPISAGVSISDTWAK